MICNLKSWLTARNYFGTWSCGACFVAFCALQPFRMEVQSSVKITFTRKHLLSVAVSLIKINVEEQILHCKWQMGTGATLTRFRVLQYWSAINMIPNCWHFPAKQMVYYLHPDLSTFSDFKIPSEMYSLALHLTDNHCKSYLMYAEIQMGLTKQYCLFLFWAFSTLNGMSPVKYIAWMLIFMFHPF